VTQNISNGERRKKMEETYGVVDLSAPYGVQVEALGKVNPRELVERLIPIRDALSKLIEPNSKFGLESLEVSLTLTAEGGVAFIAKGSAEASLTLTFARPKP
jgi:hypothetical protein